MKLIDFAVVSSTKTTSDIADIIKAKALDTAIEHLPKRSQAEAFQMQAVMAEALVVAETMAETLGGMKTAGVAVDVGRDAVNGMLKAILTDHDAFSGVYTAWETDAFDMLDQAFVGVKGHDKAGRFIAYRYRDCEGKSDLTACSLYDNAEMTRWAVRKGASA